MIKTTFETIWEKSLETVARQNGAVDGDLHRVRTAAKNLLVAAGWAQPSGDCSFVSDADLQACVSAAVPAVTRAAKQAESERRLAPPTPGLSPTKRQIMAGAETVELTSAQLTASAFSPQMAQVGDRCPRCSGSMEPVGLVNERAGLYCVRDRVVLPLASEQAVRS